MVDATDLKPSFQEWMHWAQVVIDRLTTVVHVYNKPPHIDVFLPDSERQLKVGQAVDLLRHLHKLTDETDPGPRLSETEIAARKDGVVRDLVPHLRDFLRRLPTWSSDMQKLLKSPWYDDCNGKLAYNLFCGPEKESEGIGSGIPENGRLPAALQELFEREQMGDVRAPCENLPDAREPTLKREEFARLWKRRQRSSLGSAGRVD